MDAGVEATKERLPDVLSKNPAAAHGFVGRSPASAEEDGLSLGHVSLAIQRKVARPPQVDETLLL